MSFRDRKFQQAYLRLISEQTEQAVIPTGVCKKCNLSFTDDVAKVGEACPECGETIEAYDVADYAGDGIDMPEPYEKPAEECNDVATECGDDIAAECGNSDILQEDDDFALADDEEANESELVTEDDEEELVAEDEEEDLAVEDEEEDLAVEDEEEDLAVEDDEEELVAEDDEEDLIPAEPINDYIVTEQDENAEDTTESDADSAEADDVAAAEDTDDAENTDLAESKIVSFTSADPAILEVFEKVQSGELKLVAVPLDFQFAEEDKNTNPDITAEVLDNFDIENVTDSNDEETAEDTEEVEAAPAADENAEGKETKEAEETEEAEAAPTPSKQEKVVKECKVKKPTIAKVKFNKQGPY